MAHKPVTRAQAITRLKAFTKALEDHGHQAEQLAPLLAARGWPTGTTSDGPRSTSELTSVEAAVNKPSPYDDIDTKYTQVITAIYALTLHGEYLLTKITAHAALDEDHQGRSTGTGAGSCLACNRWVPGTAEDRLRAGWCQPCRTAWYRAGRPDRAAFMHTRPKHDDPPPRTVPTSNVGTPDATSTDA